MLLLPRDGGAIETVVGRRDSGGTQPNGPRERDPLRLSLPAISSLDYDGGRLFAPTDLDDGAGDLAVLRRT